MRGLFIKSGAAGKREEAWDSENQQSGGGGRSFCAFVLALAVSTRLESEVSSTGSRLWPKVESGAEVRHRRTMRTVECSSKQTLTAAGTGSGVRRPLGEGRVR